MQTHPSAELSLQPPPATFLGPTTSPMHTSIHTMQPCPQPPGDYVSSPFLPASPTPPTPPKELVFRFCAELQGLPEPSSPSCKPLQRALSLSAAPAAPLQGQETLCGLMQRYRSAANPQGHRHQEEKRQPSLPSPGLSWRFKITSPRSMGGWAEHVLSISTPASPPCHLPLASPFPPPHC